MKTESCKIEIFLPEEALEEMMAALAGAHAGEIGNYDHCFTISPVTGTFRPREGSQPYSGEVGKISRVNEIKVEVNCHEKYVTAAVQAARQAHPYEEPVINVIRLQNGEFGATQ